MEQRYSARFVLVEVSQQKHPSPVAHSDQKAVEATVECILTARPAALDVIDSRLALNMLD